MAPGRHVVTVGSSLWWPVARRVGQVLCAVLSLLLVVGFWYGWRNYRNLDQHLRRLSIGGLGLTTPSGSASAERDIDGTDQNLLIVGNDDRNDMTDAEVRALGTGRDGGSINTDTMMIVHIPADGSKATLISLPRDSYVTIPGFRANKLNAAYPDGYYYNAGKNPSLDDRRAAGATQLIRTVRLLTGLQIDHFLQVDLLGFYRISKAIGPVTVNLCEAVSDRNAGLHLPAGINHIVGQTALAFVRQRETLHGGDLARVQRQRYFLTAAFRKIASAGTLLNPGRLQQLISAVDSSIYVDNNNFSIQSLAEQVADLSANNIVGQTIPVEDERIIDGVGDVLIVDPAKVRARVAELVGGTVPPPSSSSSSSTAASSSGSPAASGTTTQAPIDAGCIH